MKFFYVLMVIGDECQLDYFVDFVGWETADWCVFGYELERSWMSIQITLIFYFFLSLPVHTRNQKFP